MGQLSHEPFINHFSHPHPLELTRSTTTPPCSACKLQTQQFSWLYTCKLCNFILHPSCATMPYLINHPSHQPDHPLTLLSLPAYPGALFNCDACGQSGYGFSYHCALCDFDLHMLCASKPLLLFHSSHPHQLQLTFHPPYNTKGFSCDICRNIGTNHWLYRCAPCGFDAHLDCATNTNMNQGRARSLMQSYSSLPRLNPNVQQAGGMIYYGHSQSMGSMQVQNSDQVAAAAGTNGSGNALANAAVQGFVEGASQQIGQSFAQSLMAGDGGGNGGENSCGADGSSNTLPSVSVISIGSSILSGVFGDSETQN